MKALAGALALTTVFVAAPAAAAGVDYLLEIEGIKGESTSTVRPHAIDLLSWSWGLSVTTTAGAGGGTGKVSLQDFHFTQLVDSTTPRLLTWVGGADFYRDVTFDATRPDAAGNAFSFFQIAFPDTYLSSFMLGGSSGGGDPVTQVSLAMTEATMKYRSSSTAAWVTGTFTVVNDQLSFTGDPTVLMGYTQAITGAVPEPSTWGLMLGGLALTGCAALRRRRV